MHIILVLSEVCIESFFTTPLKTENDDWVIIEMKSENMIFNEKYGDLKRWWKKFELPPAFEFLVQKNF